MPDIYDEFGRLIEKPKKPSKPEWGEADYPYTFAISLVNGRTGEGIKDLFLEPKLKTAKGAIKKAWNEYSGIVLQEALPNGAWFEQQRPFSDLYLVARPIWGNRDVDQAERRAGPFSSSSPQGAFDFVASPPEGPQRFKEPGSDWSSGLYYEPNELKGPSTRIPLLEFF
jgi:hypothetical protein